MKEKELRELAACGGCGKKLMKGGNIFFWKVTIDRYAFDHNAMRSQTGLGMMIGAGLAEVMGPDQDMAKRIGPPVILSLCQDCFLTPQNLAAIEEAHSEEESEVEA